MKQKLKAAWELIRMTFAEWSDDQVPRLAAALAYYTIFSLAPLLVIAIAVAGFALGREAAEGRIMAQMSDTVGPSGAQMIENMVRNASRPGSGLVATVLGVVALLFGATGVFGELQSSLNTIFDVKLRPDAGIGYTLWHRLLSFVMVLVIGLVLLVLAALSAAISGLSHYLSGIMPGLPFIVETANFIVSVGVATVLFAMIFKLLPDAEIAWRDVWLGAALTAVLFTIGKLLIGLYLGMGSATSIYGAAGSLVVILLWVYYSAQIFFLGAEFTQVYANRYGSNVRPAAKAEPVAGEEPQQAGTPSEPGRPSAPARPS